MHKNEIKCKYVSDIMYSLVIKISINVVGTQFKFKSKAAIVTACVWQMNENFCACRVWKMHTHAHKKEILVTSECDQAHDMDVRWVGTRLPWISSCLLYLLHFFFLLQMYWKLCNFIRTNAALSAIMVFICSLIAIYALQYRI